jgi:hypothetical protein
MTISSSAQKPDLDWSQVRETVRMMNLAVAQIETSMRQGDDSVDTLTNAFTTMVGRIQVIESLAQKKGRSQQIVEQCEAVSAEMKHTIMAFQFYDILTQRLSHVSHSLESLTDLVGDSTRLYSPVEWSLLQEKIKSKYTITEEHHMFDMVMQGMSVEDALQQTQRPEDGGVELF